MYWNRRHNQSLAGLLCRSQMASWHAQPGRGPGWWWRRRGGGRTHTLCVSAPSPTPQQWTPSGPPRTSVAPRHSGRRSSALVSSPSRSKVTQWWSHGGNLSGRATNEIAYKVCEHTDNGVFVGLKGRAKVIQHPSIHPNTCQSTEMHWVCCLSQRTYGPGQRSPWKGCHAIAGHTHNHTQQKTIQISLTACVCSKKKQDPKGNLRKQGNTQLSQVMKYLNELCKAQNWGIK